MKYEREGYFITVDIEKGMQDGQVRMILSNLKYFINSSKFNPMTFFTAQMQEILFYEDGEPVIDGEPGDLKVWCIRINDSVLGME